MLTFLSYIAVAVIGSVVGGQINQSSYGKLLLSKSRRHSVEFIEGKPIVLVPEKDYLDLQIELAKYRYREGQIDGK
jgi:hypothetical protein